MTFEYKNEPLPNSDYRLSLAHFGDFYLGTIYLWNPFSLATYLGWVPTGVGYYLLDAVRSRLALINRWI